MNWWMRISVRTLKMLAAVILAPIVSAAPGHPPDALDANEIARSAAILRDNGHTDSSTPILSLTLEQRDNQAVSLFRSEPCDGFTAGRAGRRELMGQTPA